jgi:hypothetical protein
MREKFEKFGAHLFEIDETLHDVRAVDAATKLTNGAYAERAAALAFEEDERARVNREAAGMNGYPGRKFEADAGGLDDDGDDGDCSADKPEPLGADDPDHVAKAAIEDAWVSAWAQAGDREGWLDVNPLGVPTERECQTVDSGGRCYRVMLVRNDRLP